FQRVDDAMGAFEEDERGAQVSEFGEEAAPVAIFLGKEAEEAETVGGKARESKRGYDRRGAGATGDGDAFGGCFPSEAIAGIRDQWHAGIADEGDRFSRLEPGENAGPDLRGIMLVIGLKPV